MRKQDDETAMEFIRRVVSWLDSEFESLLSDLPTVESVFEFAELWTVYDTDFADGIFEAIQEGADPKPFADFVAKYNLNWNVPAAA